MIFGPDDEVHGHHWHIHYDHYLGQPVRDWRVFVTIDGHEHLAGTVGEVVGREYQPVYDRARAQVVKFLEDNA